MARYFLFVISIFFASASFADTYYWTSGGPQDEHFPSALAACPSSVNLSYAANNPVPVTSVKFTSPNSGSCVYFVEGKYGGTDNYQGSSVGRYGDSCPDGATYNDLTGSCDLAAQSDGEKCLDQTGSKGPGDPMIFSSKSGKCVLFSESDDDATCHYLGSSGGSGTSYTVAGNWDGGVPSAPPTFTSGGLSCEVSTVSTTECVTNTKGEVSCTVIGKFNGNTNNKTDIVDAKDAACLDASCKPPEAQTKTEDKPCVYSGGGDSQSCTSETSTDKQGTQSCGTVNGALTCVYSKPNSLGTKIDTTVTSQTAPDGSKTITKTDNATKTNCTDIKACTTSSSTTVTTSHQNAAGQSTGTSSTCKGACNSDGTGITPGKGDGTGDGSGDGDCTKDCVPGLSGEDSITKTTQAFQSRIAGSPVAKAVGNIKISSGGVCYAPTIELFETAFVLDWHCQIAEKVASTISIITKAAWALLAVMVFLSA